MASYVIVFRAPKKVGPYGTKPSIPEAAPSVTDISDYKRIRNVFKSNLLKKDKFICIHDKSGSEQEVIYNMSMEGKKRVCFEHVNFTKNLRQEVPADKLDKDTVVYFIDADTAVQTAINVAADGDVISLIDNHVVDAPLVCEDKAVTIDLCGCTLKTSDGKDVESSTNITIKNSVVNKPGSVVPDDTPKVIIVDPSIQTVADVIAIANPGDTIVLPAGTYSAPLSIDKPIKISGKLKEDGTYEDVVVSGTVSAVCDGGTVEFNHIKFAEAKSSTGTGSGKRSSYGSAVSVSGSCDLNLVGCSIENESFYYNIINIATTGKVVIDGLQVGDNESYHVIEFGVTNPVKDGTVIKNCNFSGNACSHNVISMYAYEEGANITLWNNHFDRSASAYRFSSNGATANISIDGNSYDTTDSATDVAAFENGTLSSDHWAGLITFQQFKEDMDLSKLNVRISGTKYAGKDITENVPGPEQLYVVCMDSSDWTMTFPNVEIV